MKKGAADPYRDIDFSRARRGPVIARGSGKTKISIRLDSAVLDYFHALAERAGGGNYQTLINEALREYVYRRSALEDMRQVVREELTQYGARGRAPSEPGRPPRR